MNEQDIDESHKDEALTCRIADVEKELQSFPLGARLVERVEGKVGHRYELKFRMKRKELVKFEKLVYTYAKDFPSFMRMLIRKHLLSHIEAKSSREQ